MSKFKDCLKEKIEQLEKLDGYTLGNFLPEKFKSRNLICFATDPKGNPCAIKFSANHSTIKHEIDMMNLFSNINIMQATGFIERDDFCGIVMPKADGGDLLEVSSNSTLTESQIQHILFSLFSALQNIHSAGYIHLDVKLENIFVMGKNVNSNIVLGDLELTTKPKKLIKICGTDGYIAPEIYKSQKIDFKADIWSAGAVMYKLYFREFPLEFADDDLNFNFTLPSKYTLKNETIDLMNRILCIDPKERITAEQALNHPYFNLNLNERVVIDVCAAVNEIDAGLNYYDVAERKAIESKKEALVLNDEKKDDDELKKEDLNDEKKDDNESKKEDLVLNDEKKDDDNK